MCGLAGYYCWGDARPPVESLRKLFLAQQTRGSDAAGLAYEHGPGDIRVMKHVGPAAELDKSLAASDAWPVIARSPRAIFHARAQTKGDKKDNVNNHPVVGMNWLVVHNGLVSNDDALWDYYAEPRFAEVDTSAIPLVLSRGGDDYLASLRHVTVLAGSVTAALWGSTWPDRIALLRLGWNDLYVFPDPAHEIVYWSSAGSGVAAIPHTLRLGSLRFINASRLPDDRLLILEPDSPFQARSYRVSRSPFSGRRINSGRSGTPTGTQLSFGSQGITLKWESLDPTEYPRKPLLQMPTPPSKFVWEEWNLDRIHERTRAIAKSLTMYTPLGRWIFEKKPNFEINRKFKPYKSYKKFLRREFGYIPVFASSTTVHNDKMTLLLLTEHQQMGPEATWQRSGYICPWCGIWARIQTWLERKYQCPFCLITSKHTRPAER